MLEYRDKWMVWYRRHATTRGSNTNNYSESNIGTIKRYVFRRKKAVNMVQMLTYAVVQLDGFFSNRLLDKIRGAYTPAKWLRELGISISIEDIKRQYHLREVRGKAFFKQSVIKHDPLGLLNDDIIFDLCRRWRRSGPQL